MSSQSGISALQTEYRDTEELSPCVTLAARAIQETSRLAGRYYNGLGQMSDVIDWLYISLLSVK